MKSQITYEIPTTFILDGMFMDIEDVQMIDMNSWHPPVLKRGWKNQHTSPPPAGPLSDVCCFSTLAISPNQPY